MDYRQLGATPLQVSSIGFGAAALGGVYGEIDVATGVRAVRTALELGVTFIDVSPYYGSTLAETVLGKALAGVPRDSYVLATKVGRYSDTSFDFSADGVTASVDASLSRLGVDHIDLIQCHDVEFGNLDQVVQETVPALRELAGTGKVRYVGVTGYPLAALEYITSRVATDTVLSYCHYTLQDHSLLRWLPAFQEQRLGVINASVLSMGALTTQGAPPWHPGPPELIEACAEAARLCTERGSDISQLAVQFSTALAGVSSTLMGAADPVYVQRNIAWAEEPMDADLLADVEAVLAGVRDLNWPNGRPENAHPVTDRG
ncbi:aldo/keto reductase [Acidothermaceae bacterium B102]|nr:aldo/keto reductase [Acidothermaceae bacterium B102]